MVLRIVYGCNHNSLRESCKFYRFRIQAVHTCTRPCRSRAHDHVQAVYTCTRPYTRLVHSRVDGRVRVHDTAVYMARTLPCTRAVYMHARVHARLCTRTVYTAVYKPCTRPCTPHGPCTGHVYGRVLAEYAKQQLNN